MLIHMHDTEIDVEIFDVGFIKANPLSLYGLLSKIIITGTGNLRCKKYVMQTLKNTKYH